MPLIQWKKLELNRAIKLYIYIYIYIYRYYKCTALLNSKWMLQSFGNLEMSAKTREFYSATSLSDRRKQVLQVVNYTTRKTLVQMIEFQAGESTERILFTLSPRDPGCPWLPFRPGTPCEIWRDIHVILRASCIVKNKTNIQLIAV